MKPRLLDLFCGAGGCSVGYARAGFDVVGVDIAPQPHYPFEFHQGDAMTWPLDGFDVIHASPPCQAFTTLSNGWRARGGVADSHPDLIAATRERLVGTDRPYVIENVPGARRELCTPVLLNGAHFGLGVHRPRLFESNMLILTPSPVDRERGSSVGVYGEKPDGRRLVTRPDGSTYHAASSLAQGAAAMGIDWMEWRELAQAIPPAYTEFVGAQLLAHLGLREASA